MIRELSKHFFANAASMTYNVLAKEFKNELRKNIQATGKHVSLIIDETTDKVTVKCMAIVIRFFF